MEDIFITEFLNLDNEFKELGVFDSIINRDITMVFYGQMIVVHITRQD